MNLKKLLSIILTLIICITCFVGCNEVKNYILYMELNDKPDTLDPQLVSGNTEELIVKNLFEGLMRKDETGKLISGVAESYEITNNKLTYTFKIRDNAKWSNGDNLTAEDFVFAFNRAVNPKTKAPYVSSLYNIVGAKPINVGENTSLGVKALDSKTLEIKLKTQDPEFLETLTTSICMPCHKNTFEKAKGQYGKVKDHIISNGSFRVRFWTKDGDFSLRLNRNEEYTGNFVSEANAIIFSAGDTKGRAARIDKKNLDLGFIDFSEATDQSNLFTFEKTCYALVINKDSAIGSKTFRNAYSLAIHRNRMKNELSKSLSESSMLLPSSVLLNGDILSKKIKSYAADIYNPDEAYKLYLNAVKEIGKPPASTEIVYYGGQDVTKMARLVAENFQQAFGAVVNLKATDSETDLLSTVKAKNYQLAIVPITAQNSSVNDFLNAFISDSKQNIYGFKSEKYDSEVKKINPTSNETDIIKTTENALQLIMQDLSIIPLCHATEAFAYGKDFSVPTISTYGGVVDMALVRKIK